MSGLGDWVPPARIEELYAATAGNLFSATNRPTAGARTDVELPRGDAPFQLYSLATPNGQKVGILLEELGVPYDAHVIRLNRLQQFDKGFVKVNPNSKIPSAVDWPDHDSAPLSNAPLSNGPPGARGGDGGGGALVPVRLFESGSIMLYLAEKHNRFIPTEPALRAECLNWVFWQMAGQGPMSGNFGHFMVYGPADAVAARNYGVARYGMEVQRLCSVLDSQLEGKEFLVGGMYTIADMICLPWFAQLRTGYRHPSGVGANTFLDVAQWGNLGRWADRLLQRPQVQRGMVVCRKHGKPWLADPKPAWAAKL